MDEVVTNLSEGKTPHTPRLSGRQSDRPNNHDRHLVANASAGPVTRAWVIRGHQIITGVTGPGPLKCSWRRVGILAGKTKKQIHNRSKSKLVFNKMKWPRYKVPGL